MTRPEHDAMTVVEQADPGHTAPGHTVPGVGSRLAAARERMGWALPDVAATLRIREPHLRAIEAGHSAELPAPAYAIGFVRSYATLLGLDPDDMARRYRAELGGEHRNTDLQFPAPVPERGVPAGAVVVLGAVIAIGAYIGWYRLSGEQPAPEPVAAATDRLVTPAVVPPAPPPAAPPATSAPPPGAAAPTVTSSPMTPAPITASAQETTPSGTPASAATAPASAPLASPTPPSQVAAAAPDTAPAAADTATAMTPPTNPPSPPATPVPASAPAQAAGDAAGAPAVAAEDSRILLRARADSWIEVHDRKGHIFFSRILHSGETWPVPNQPEGAPQLLLTTGNAGGTEIVVDGTPAPSLGAAGKVRRDVPLDATLIASGKPAAANAGTHSSNPAQ